MSLLKHALWYSGTNLIVQGALFAQAFVVRALIIPEVMGFWNLVGVIKGYVLPISSGVTNGAFRELPILKGQGKSEEEVRCRQVTLTASLAEGGILFLGVAGYVVWRRFSSASPEAWVYLTAGIMLISVRLQECYITFFQSANRYLPLSRILLLNGLIYSISLPLGAAAGGLSGLLIAALVAEIVKGVCMIYFGCRQGLQVGFGYDRAILKRLVSFGLGYRITDYPMSLFLMMDVLWVTWFMGTANLALYAMGRVLSLQALDISARMGTLVYTRILEDYGKGISKREIGESLYSFLQLELLLVFPLVCWAVASFMPFLVRQFTPLYGACIPVLMVLLIGGFFVPQNNHLFALWIAEKRLVPYGIANLFGLLAVSLAIIIFWYVLGWRHLHQIALAAALGYALQFTYTMVVLGRLIFGGRRTLKLGGQIVCAAGWTGVVVFLIFRWQPEGLTFSQDLLCTAPTAGFGLAALLPLLVVGLLAAKHSRLLLFRW